MDVRSDLPCKVEAALARLGIGPSNGVIAVSGGPDSMALLRALLAVREPSPGRLIIAHLNHQLRGEESDADEAFVRDTVARLGPASSLELRTERLAIAERAREEGGNVEALARRVRYDWLTQVAREEQASWVATGHTADDQAETVLHRLLRGAGLKGLRGIAPCRPLARGILLVRPLLGVRREAVMGYLQELGQPFRTDSSNLNRDYTRNRLRAELLPLLARDYNPRVVEVLCRLAEQAEETFQAEEEQARRLLETAELPRAGLLVVLDRHALARAPRRLVRELLRLVWEREGWPMGAMGFDAWERAAGVVHGETTAVDLPGGLRMRSADRVVLVGPAS